MTARARRGGGLFLPLSAALHLLIMAAAIWGAGRTPPLAPAEAPVALVWDNRAEGAGNANAGGGVPAPPVVAALPPADAAPQPSAPPAVAPPPAPPQAEARPAEPTPAPAMPPAAPARLAELPVPPLPLPLPPVPVVAPSAPALPPPPAEPPPPPQRLAAAAPPTTRPRPAANPRQSPPQDAAAPHTLWRPPARPVPPGLDGAQFGDAVAAGGLVTGPVIPARPAAGAANPAPDYPRASRMRGEEGRVTLLVQVDRSGHVHDLSVLGSSGHEALDQEAARAVRRWRFEPATQSGAAVFSVVTVGITFRLEGQRRW